MSQNEITSKVATLRELLRMSEELTAEIESIKDELKAHMDATETDTLTGTDYKITYKPVTSTRIDSTKLKKDFPDIYTEYGITTTSRRFMVK